MPFFETRLRSHFATFATNDSGYQKVVTTRLIVEESKTLLNMAVRLKQAHLVFEISNDCGRKIRTGFCVFDLTKPVGVKEIGDILVKFLSKRQI